MPTTQYLLHLEILNAELRTSNLSLRPVRDQDASRMVAIDRDPLVQAHLLDYAIDSPLKALAVITHAQQLRGQTDSLGFWSAFNDQDEYLGYFSLMPSPSESTSPDIELGVKLSPAAWGQFIALKGGRLLCDFAKQQQLPGLVGIFAPANRVIPILLTRLGFKPDGQLTHFGQAAVRYRLEF